MVHLFWLNSCFRGTACLSFSSSHPMHHAPSNRISLTISEQADPSSSHTKTKINCIVFNIASRHRREPKRGQLESNETTISYDKLSLNMKKKVIWVWEEHNGWMSTDNYAISPLTHETQLVWLDLRQRRRMEALYMLFTRKELEGVLIGCHWELFKLYKCVRVCGYLSVCIGK